MRNYYNYYYVSRKEYIINQLERNGIQAGDLDVSNYSSVCETAEYIANLLDGKGLLNSRCSDVVSDYIHGRKKPFVFLTLKDMKYYFESFDAVIWAVSEYRVFGLRFDFITIIWDKLTEEVLNEFTGEFAYRQRYFGRTIFRPDKLHVLGKVSFDENKIYGENKINKIYIQPIIIY